MKRLLFASLALLAACNQAPSLSPEQAQVEAFIKKQADDPASYQSVRWGKMKRWQQQDLDSMQALVYAEREQGARETVKENEKQNQTYRGLGIKLDTFSLRMQRRDKAAIQIAQKKKEELQASQDTTYRGTSLWHTFRLKNKFGALVLDSANFLLHPDGKIEVEKKSPAA